LNIFFFFFFFLILYNKTNQLQRLRTIVISISPQSRASLASKYNLTIQQVYDKLNWFFKEHLGVNYVVDTSFSRDFSIIESAKEFVNRYTEYYKNNNKQGVLPMISSSCPGKNILLYKSIINNHKNNIKLWNTNDIII